LEHPGNDEISARAVEVSQDGNWATIITKENIVYLVDLHHWSITDSIKLSEAPRKICFYAFPRFADSIDRQRFWLITQPGIYYEYEFGSDGKLLETGKWTSDGERVFNALERPDTQERFTLDSKGQVKRWVQSGAEWLLDHKDIAGGHRGHLLVDSSRWLEPSVSQLKEHLFVYTLRNSIDFFSSRGQWQRFFVRTKTACVCDVGRAGLWVIDQPTIAKSVSWNTVIKQFQSADPNKWTEVELPWQERALPFRADELNHPSQFYRLVATDDGRWIAGWDEQAGCVWCMPPDRPKSVRQAAAPEVTSVWFEPASHCCWWISRHRRIYRWNLADGSSPQMVTELPNLSVRALAMSPDKSLLAIQCEHRTCYLLDLNQNKIVSEITFEDDLLDIAFSESGKTLMMLGLNGRVACWNVVSGRKTFQQAYSTRNIRGGFSQDGRYLIRSSQDNDRWSIEPLGLVSGD
jgi:WD40 repeat protein